MFRTALYWGKFRFFVLLACFFSGAAAASQITYVQVNNTSSQSMMDAPVTFGQVFAPGDVSSGRALTASIGDKTIPLQVDVKATHPNGSVRHAILTAMLSDMPASGTKTIELGTGSRSNEEAAAQLPDSLDASVVLNIGGQLYSVSFRELLTSGVDRVWLSGPLVTEWQVSGPVVNGSGQPHDRIAVQFYVRYYERSGRARIAVVIENTWAFKSNPRNVTYDVQILVNDQVRYVQSGLTHTDHARWREVLWVGGDPKLSVGHDLAYLKATGAIPNYDPGLQVPESAVVDMYKRYVDSDHGPLEISIVTNAMNRTGGRPDIGALPGWTVLRLLTMDPRLIEVNQGIGVSAGSWPIHLRDEGTGMPVSLENHPNLTTHPNLRYWGKNPLPVAEYGEHANNLRPDVSHQPSMAFVPYLLTGDYYFLEELQFWAAWNPLRTSPKYRGEEQGLMTWTSVRGQAWSLRTLGQVAYITPDKHLMKAYWKRQLQHNLDWYNEHYANNPDANKLGFVDDRLPYNGGRGLAPWQDDFFTWAMGYVVDLGFEKARPMLEYKARFPVGRMTAPGYCWVLGAMYSMNVREGGDSTPFYDTFARAYQESVSLEAQQAECVSAEMAALLGRNYEAGDMSGYPWSPQGFPANMQPALAAAVNADVPNADLAWQIFMNRTTKPDYSSDPNWAIVPREKIAQKPVISFYATPNPVRAGEPTVLHWQAYNAGVCNTSWAGQTTVSGSENVASVADGDVYTLDCTGVEGEARSSVTLRIAGFVQEPGNGGDEDTTPGSPSDSGGGSDATPGSPSDSGGDSDATPGSPSDSGGDSDATPGSPSDSLGDSDAGPGPPSTNGGDKDTTPGFPSANGGDNGKAIDSGGTTSGASPGGSGSSGGGGAMGWIGLLGLLVMLGIRRHNRPAA